MAPLDNLLWDRKLIETLFDFSYTWKIYTPKAKRKDSYYVFPVLQKDRFIGRIEMVNDKDQRVLNVKNLWFEEGLSLNHEEEQNLFEAIQHFRVFSEMNTINITKELNFR